MKKIIWLILIILILTGGVFWFINQEPILDINNAQSENIVDVRNQNIIEKCNTELDKEKCLSIEAKKLKDRNICNLIPGAKNYCLSSYGIEFKDIESCNLIEEIQNSQSKELCYQYVAYELKDENICYNLLSDGPHYRECFGKLAFVKKNGELCKETGDYEEYCVRAIDTGVEWSDYRN